VRNLLEITKLDCLSGFKHQTLPPLGPLFLRLLPPDSSPAQQSEASQQPARSSSNLVYRSHKGRFIRL
jgi:hypothetical protein